MSGAPVWQAVATVVVPIAAVLVPGIAIVRLTDFRDLLYNGARALLLSAVILILGSFIGAVAGVPMVYVAIAVVAVSLIAIAYRRRDIFCLSCGWTIMALVTPLVLGTAAFAAPYLLRFDGLPTGDSQKAIFWGQDVLENNALPNYERSTAQLNRDQGDFFTPGLHTYTALIMSAAPEPLVAVGLIAIALAVAVAWIAAAISKELFDDSPHIVPPLLAALFVLTNFRFLRYLREPGYHFQNLVGELLLFGLLLVGLRLMRRFTWPDAALALGLGLALVLSHQFSVFVGFFALAPLAIVYWVRTDNRALRLGLIVLVAALALIALPFGLYEKIPHLFTADTHLQGLLPMLVEYPQLLGTVWLTLGLAGLVTLIISTRRFGTPARWSFIAATVLLLALSQGPRLFLDIPPVRALLYSVVPLSICAAYFVMRLRHYADSHSRPLRAVLITSLALLVLLPMGISVSQAFTTSKTSVPTNSTLTSDQLHMIEVLKGGEGAVLIDDRGRRADSWLLLSNRPMFTRLTSDIRRQMNEANQSQVRNQLYVRQLEFEKIYMLASHPAAAYLATQLDIGALAGVIGGSHSGLMENLNLQEISRAGKTVLYRPSPSTYQPTELDTWLLRTSTLVNDIGDREDTLPHLPAALRTPRLSEPQTDGPTTFRTTTSPIIPLRFNVGDYVQVLWDQEQTQRPDTDLELYIATVFDSSPLTVVTNTGARYGITPGAPTTIAAKDVHLEEDGVEFQLENPQERVVGIDMIAVGLARIP